MSNWISAALRLLNPQPVFQTYAWIDRRATYQLWDTYYANTVYESTSNGGQRDAVNAELGGAAAADLAGLYNPVAAVVDLYLHVFGGAFGDEIRVEPQGVAQAGLVDAIEQIWRWSNLTIEKQPLCRLAATHGAVGLRIVAHNDLDASKRRVYIKPEHPKLIRDLELDDRGNIAAIQLEYDLSYGLAEDAQTVTIRETMTKETITTERVVGAGTVPFDRFERVDNGLRASYPNELGVVPYVILRHEHIGDVWGRNAFYKMRGPIDRLNSLMSHIDVQIHRHVRAKWLVAAGGTAPQEFDFSDLTIVYVDTRNNPGTPTAQAMVANLDLQGAIQQSREQMDAIEDNLPELKATQGKFLSGQSGETIAELRKPAEQKLSLARVNYEDALVRAQQIAVSWGVLLDLWDVGTGSGTREAADRAFHEGFEEHRFNKRPLLDEPTAGPKQDAPAVPTATSAPDLPAPASPPPPPPAPAGAMQQGMIQ